MHSPISPRSMVILASRIDLALQRKDVRKARALLAIVPYEAREQVRTMQAQLARVRITSAL